MDCKSVDPNCEKQLVFTNGNAKTSAMVSDSQFAISEGNTLKLVREVEMFLWVESSHEDIDNNITYTYQLEWKSTFIDSSKFNCSGGHENDESKWVV